MHSSNSKAADPPKYRMRSELHERSMAIRRPAMRMEGPLTSRPDMLPNLPKVYHHGHIEPGLGWVPNDYYLKAIEALKTGQSGK